MKKLILFLLFLSICSVCFAEDRVRIQIQFRKGAFQCQDGTEEVVDFSVKGGNTYEHTCKDGKWTNSFLDYSGTLSFTPEEYEKIDLKRLEELKDEKIAAWQYERKNPPPYIEPTPEDLQKEIDDLEMRKAEVVSRKLETVAKIEALKAAEKITVEDK